MRPEKTAIIDEYSGALEKTGYTILVDYQGLSVEKISALRGKLEDVDSKVQVVKNALLKKALSDRGEGAELSDGLTGPTAMVAGDGEVTQVAKVLKAFAKENQLPEVKGGLLKGKTLTADDVKQMASIPPREVLLGSVVGTIAAPMSSLVGVFHQKVCSLLYVLKAVEEKKQ